MHNINPKGKFILSPQEQCQGTWILSLIQRTINRNWHTNMVTHPSTNLGRCWLTPLYQAADHSRMPITIDKCLSVCLLIKFHVRKCTVFDAFFCEFVTYPFKSIVVAWWLQTSCWFWYTFSRCAISRLWNVPLTRHGPDHITFVTAHWGLLWPQMIFPEAKMSSHKNWVLNYELLCLSQSIIFLLVCKSNPWYHAYLIICFPKYTSEEHWNSTPRSTEVPKDP